MILIGELVTSKIKSRMSIFGKIDFLAFFARSVVCPSIGHEKKLYFAPISQC